MSSLTFWAELISIRVGFWYKYITKESRCYHNMALQSKTCCPIKGYNMQYLQEALAAMALTIALGGAVSTILVYKFLQ